jgi:RNA polymerase sigma-70 factor (ECF subfamily)
VSGGWFRTAFKPRAASTTEGPKKVDPLAELVPRIVQGDALAVNTLLRGVAPVMLRTIRRLLGPQNSDAEDVLQEAMMRLLKALASFRGESTVAHFAVRIAMRTAADTVRGYSRRRRLRDAAELVSSIEATSTSFEGAVAAKQEVALLLHERLSSVQLETLVLKNVLGHSLEEVAEMMEVPVNTVRGRLQTAKRSVRDVIVEAEQGGEP